VLKVHVASVCFKYFRGMCCKCFIRMLHMLQWLYIYVANAYSQCFICFHTYVASVFILMLHIFHTYVESVLSRCCVCLQWFSSVFSCFCKYFRRMFHVFHLFFYMLQVLHLDVSKVDRVLHVGCKGGAA
jgi:CBS domain containing-hemolysin-like protein